MTQRPHDPGWRPGRILRDKWRIDARIARGGMGTVFAATHQNNGSRVAIKVLHPEFTQDPDTHGRFLQEGYAANRVNHPGVVRVLDDDVSEEGLAYLVMELLDGQLVEQRRIEAGGSLPLEEVYAIGDQLLDVLIAAHAKGIIHRDIKPDNLFLTDDGRLKVLDFGFARLNDGSRTERTVSGVLLGTPGFMSPEQATGKRDLVDPRTDLWAVGATLFVLLTGQPVHEGETAAEILVAAANYQPRGIATLDPRLPTKLCATIDRALAYDQGQRWPDARAMQLALRSINGWRTAMSEPSSSKTLASAPPVEHIDSMYTPTAQLLLDPEHPADGEAETIAREGPVASARPAQQTSRLPSFHDLDDIPGEPRDSTVMMEMRPRTSYHDIASALDDTFAQESPPVPPPPPRVLPALPAVIDPRTVRTVHRHAGGTRVLVFIAVAGFAMVVVIIAGLLLILGTD